MEGLASLTSNGLVLSGGGARGFAHLGVLQALEENNIRIDRISGVSAGAIAAAFYASGFHPVEIMNLLMEKNFLRYFKLSLPDKGLVKNYTLFRLMRRMLPEKIEDLNIPVTITVTNLNQGKAEYLSQGPLARIVLASTSIPVIFHPVFYRNINYADGGIMNNLPIEPLKDSCNFIIASHVNPICETDRLGSIFKIMERCFQLAINESTIQKSRLCQIMIEPSQLSEYKIFDFKKAAEIFDIGYAEANRVIQAYRSENNDIH